MTDQEQKLEQTQMSEGAAQKPEAAGETPETGDMHVAGGGAETEIKRVVVVAVDGSPNSKHAFKFYLNNVRRQGDKVFLVHSVEINEVLHSTQWYNSPYSFDKGVLFRLLEEEKFKIKSKLEGYAKYLRDAGMNGTVKSIHAESPGHGIVKAADEVGATVIVVGCRGLGTLRRTFLGSVSDYIVHHATVPVLVCRHDDDDDEHHQHQHKH